MSDQPKVIMGRKFLEALADAGIIRREDNVCRVVIDAQVRDAVVIHVERIGDERLLHVVRQLDGMWLTRGGEVRAGGASPISAIGGIRGDD